MAKYLDITTPIQIVKNGGEGVYSLGTMVFLHYENV